MVVARVKVSKNFRITIPVEVRRRLGIEAGEVLVVRLEGDRIVVERPRVADIKIKLGRAVDWTYVEEVVNEAGDEIAEECCN